MILVCGKCQTNAALAVTPPIHAPPILSKLSRGRERTKVASNAYRQIGQHQNGVHIEMDLLQVGSEPVGMRCPYCQEDVMTRATYRNTTLTHVIAGVLAFFFWWLCCCILPYVTKRWKNVEHYCPSCQRFLGVYTRNSII